MMSDYSNPNLNQEWKKIPIIPWALIALLNDLLQGTEFNITIAIIKY